MSFFPLFSPQKSSPLFLINMVGIQIPEYGTQCFLSLPFPVSSTTLPKLSASHLIPSKLSENTSLCDREGTLFVAIMLFFTPPLLLETASCLPFSFPYIVHDSAQMPSHQRRLPGPALVKQHPFHSLLPLVIHFSFNTSKHCYLIHTSLSFCVLFVSPLPREQELCLAHRCVYRAHSCAWLSKRFLNK